MPRCPAGSPSPLLYAIYINDLLSSLEQSRLGVAVGHTYCGVVAYADDIALSSTLAWVLQLMLNICHAYSFRWHYSFNAAKSGILVFGESPVSRSRARLSRSWFIDGSPIPESDSFKHLGIVLSVSGSSLQHTLYSITAARSAFYAIQSVGPRFGLLHPVSLRLFKAYSLCILRFGLDVIFPTKSELVMLERCQLAILRSLLGLPTRSNAAAIHVLLGTLPMSFVAIKAHLGFLLRVLALPDAATANSILSFRLSHPLQKSARLGLG